ncbi:MAG: pyrimidine/purine nucleoside phosphorylase [Spirochaetia bacterium]|nr:pyrimidine/purine nucleoside phosphorylase [Spirochaetia bacterium]
MKHSTYFEGKVQSLALNTNKGKATVGVMEPGKYTFNTSTEETMKVVSGSMNVKLPGKEWKNFLEGETFVVPAGKAFDLDVAIDAAYICYYK